MPLVFAGVCSHAPGITGRADQADPEVRVAGHRVGVVQVVGVHAPPDQGLEQLGERLGVVVDALQQHGLVEDGTPTTTTSSI